MPVSTLTDSTHSGEHDGADTAAVRDDGPESAEIRAQGEIRARGDETREDPDRGESRVQEALETAAAVAEETGGLGIPGQPINRRSPFMIGMLAAFGVAVAYGLIELIIGARYLLIIIGLALFVAAGLDPVVGWLVRHRVPRWAAVLVVIGCAAAVAAGWAGASGRPASAASALSADRAARTHSRTEMRKWRSPDRRNPADPASSLLPDDRRRLLLCGPRSSSPFGGADWPPRPPPPPS